MPTVVRAGGDRRNRGRGRSRGLLLLPGVHHRGGGGRPNPPCTCRRGRQAGARGSSPPSVADQVLIPGDVLCHGGWIIVLISAVPPPICRWSVVSSSGRSLCK